MNIIGHYLSRQETLHPLLDEGPDPYTTFIVVLPVYNESNPEPCLKSIEEAARFASVKVEILVVVNDTDQSPEPVIRQNRETMRWLRLRRNEYPLFILDRTGLPHKKGGVGPARKTGMDEACFRYFEAGKSGGVICSLDADTWVEANYFLALRDAFRDTARACLIIHYEHDTGTVLSERHRQAILDYELHLRYYVHALRYAGFPYAFQTLGSAFAIDARAYAAEGGMPPRQAGEDFYFIHKFSIKNEVASIGGTTVHPSSRLSDRVPFGTGKAMIEQLDGPSREMLTYAWRNFEVLGPFLHQLEELYRGKSYRTLKLESGLIEFLDSIGFDAMCSEMKKHSRSFMTFRKRFFQGMNAFMMMKCLHFMRDRYHPNEPLEASCRKLLDWFAVDGGKPGTNSEMLAFLRLKDKVLYMPS